MAAAGVARAELSSEDLPHLSFNSDITADADLPFRPTDDEVVEMKKIDPKLPYTWTVWEKHVASRKKLDYAGATKEVASFSTVKQFWSIFNHIPQPSILFSGQRFSRKEKDVEIQIEALMIFRHGIRPEWEDPENVKGGHFQIQIKPNQAGSGATLDELWNNIVLGIIAGQIEPSEMITGIRLVDKIATKKMVRIELWFNEMDKGEGGRTYELRGSFERCMRTAMDGSIRPVTWGFTETCDHTAH
jgi:translation initiation factor 4E